MDFSTNQGELCLPYLVRVTCNYGCETTKTCKSDLTKQLESDSAAYNVNIAYKNTSTFTPTYTVINLNIFSLSPFLSELFFFLTLTLLSLVFSLSEF